MPIARVMVDGRVARVEVPAGTTPEQAQAMAMEAARAQTKAPKPTSFWQGVAEGVMPYANNALRAVNKINPLLSALDAVSGASTKMADASERGTKDAVARSPYRGSTTGQLVGGALGALPTMALPGGPAVQGAVAGMLGSRSRDPKTLASNAAIGGIGGVVGDKAVGAVAKVVSPRVAPAIRALRERGIPVTPGQVLGANGGIAGRTVRGIEDKLTSIPIVGNAVQNAQRRGVESFNRAIFDEALAPVSRTVKDIAETGVEQARAARSAAYNDALDGVSIAPDAQFGDEFLAAGQRGMTPTEFGDDFTQIMREEIQPVLSNGTGQINGQDLQDALRIMRGYGRQYEKLATTGTQGRPAPSARPVGKAFREAADALEGLVERQAPDVMPAYRTANQVNRNVNVVRDAVSAAKNTGGVFTPAQLGQAARANAKKYGGTHGTTDQPFFDLQRAAQEVLPSTIPNSGTADRGIIGLLMGGTVGLPAAIPAAVAALPYTRAGQAMTQSLLTGRQGPTSRAVADAIERLRPFGLLGGAGIATGLLGS